MDASNSAVIDAVFSRNALPTAKRQYRKRTVLAVWTGLILVGILPSGHSGGVHLEVRWMFRIPQ
jgi:hypothetical protein